MENNKINKKRKIALIIWIVVIIIYLSAAIGYWFMPNIEIRQKGIIFGIFTFVFLMGITLMFLDKKREYSKKDTSQIDLYKNESLYVWDQLKKKYLLFPIIMNILNLVSTSLMIASILLISKEWTIPETIFEHLTSAGFVILYVCIIIYIISLILYWFYRITVEKIFSEKDFFKDVILKKNLHFFENEKRIRCFQWLHHFVIIGLVLSIITYKDIEDNNSDKFKTEIEIPIQINEIT